MRSHILGITLVALLAPQLGHAQVYLDPTPAPTVNAAREQWQLSGEAIFYKGDFYYPSGPTEFFDGKVMSRTGTHEGVPLYENSTLLPHEIVYVPVAAKLMKPYERRRDGQLAGTTGSRAPSFAVQPHTQAASMLDDRDQYTTRMATDRAQWDWPTPIERVEPPALASAPGRRGSVIPSGVISSVPTRETTNAGAYLQFEGNRYFSSGRAVVPNAERFSRVGDANGASVYREMKGNAKTIFVESVPSGPLAPYTQK